MILVDVILPRHKFIQWLKAKSCGERERERERERNIKVAKWIENKTHIPKLNRLSKTMRDDMRELEEKVKRKNYFNKLYKG